MSSSSSLRASLGLRMNLSDLSNPSSLSTPPRMASPIVSSNPVPAARPRLSLSALPPCLSGKIYWSKVLFLSSLPPLSLCALSVTEPIFPPSASSSVFFINSETSRKCGFVVACVVSLKFFCSCERLQGYLHRPKFFWTAFSKIFGLFSLAEVSSTVNPF
ncbi:MAG: hypothetical protein BWY75_00069 [bacterium ADurb.Bin425]|nr:MAG: hypothetical protein BWY75_00069 [bacterium ADurb.Bin425]